MGPKKVHGLRGSIGELETFGGECWTFSCFELTFDSFLMSVLTLELDMWTYLMFNKVACLWMIFQLSNCSPPSSIIYINGGEILFINHVKHIMYSKSTLNLCSLLGQVVLAYFLSA